MQDEATRQPETADQETTGAASAEPPAEPEGAAATEAAAAEPAATEPAADEPAADEPAAAAPDVAEPSAQPAPDASDTEDLRGFIFDLDGTLIDSATDLAAAVNSVLESMGRPTKPVEEIARYIGDGVHKLLARSLDTDDEQTIDEAVGTFFEHYSEHYLDHTVAYPGAKEILDHFKDKQCAVVSNKPEIFCRAILNGLGLDSNLVAIIGGDTIDAHKPDPRPFQEALDLMGIEASEAVVIGDGLPDIEGGRAAGTRTCAVTYGLTDAATLAAAGPDYTVGDLPSLAKLFS